MQMTLFNDPKKVHHITISTFLSYDLGLFATTFREYISSLSAFYPILWLFSVFNYRSYLNTTATSRRHNAIVFCV